MIQDKLVSYMIYDKSIIISSIRYLYILITDQFMEFFMKNKLCIVAIIILLICSCIIISLPKQQDNNIISTNNVVSCVDDSTKLFLYIENNTSMQAIENLTYIIDEKIHNDEIYYRGFADAMPERAYIYLQDNNISDVLLFHKKYNDDEYYVICNPQSGDILIHWINNSKKHVIEYKGDENHVFPDDVQLLDKNVYLYYYENDGINFVTIDLLENTSNKMYVKIDNFKNLRRRHSFFNNCYFDGNDTIFIPLNHSSNSQIRDELLIYRISDSSTQKIELTNGLDTFFVYNSNILISRINMNILELSQYSYSGKLINSKTIKLSSYINDDLDMNYRSSNNALIGNKLHLLLGTKLNTLNYWVTVDIDSMTIYKIKSISLKTSYSILDYVFLNDAYIATPHANN